jgi:hypothetical protein
LVGYISQTQAPRPDLLSPFWLVFIRYGFQVSDTKNKPPAFGNIFAVRSPPANRRSQNALFLFGFCGLRELAAIAIQKNLDAAISKLTRTDWTVCMIPCVGPIDHSEEKHCIDES